jgi:hypothetical protein
MIANKSVRSAISLLHLSVALCCFSVFFLIFSTELHFSFSLFYQKKELTSFIILIGIGFLSFFASLSWQTTDLRFSKSLSYLVSLCFLMESIVVLTTTNIKSRDFFILVIVPTITPAVCFFLLAFSKINQSVESDTKEYSTLDSDFLEVKGNTNLSVLWKPNRIVSFNSFVFSILLFPSLLAAGADIWSISIPCSFLVISVILWLFPKIGSWIFSVISILTSISIVGLFIALIVFKPPAGSEIVYIISGLSVVVISVVLLCCGLSMLLLSKEAKQEWKKSPLRSEPSTTT